MLLIWIVLRRPDVRARRPLSQPRRISARFGWRTWYVSGAWVLQRSETAATMRGNVSGAFRYRTWYELGWGIKKGCGTGLCRILFDIAM